GWNEQRPHHERADDGPLPALEQEARGHEADPGEHEDHHRDLEHEAEAEQEPRVEGPVVVDPRHELDVRPPEAAEELERHREEEVVAEGGSRDEEEGPEDDEGYGVELLVLVEAGGDEGPDLP